MNFAVQNCIFSSNYINIYINPPHMKLVTHLSPMCPQKHIVYGGCLLFRRCILYAELISDKMLNPPRPPDVSICTCICA